MKHVAAICAITLVACHVEFKKAPTIDDPAASMNAENTVRFDIQPDPNEPVQIAAKDVTVEPDGISLKFKFGSVVLMKSAADPPEIEPDNFQVRLYSRDAAGTLQLVRQSDAEPLMMVMRMRTLSAETPRIAFELARVARLYNVTSACERGCDVTAAIDVGHGKEARSAPAELHLMTGTGIIAMSKQGDDPCRWLAPEEAMAVAGKRMKYAAPGSGDCTMEPETGSVPTFYYTVFEQPTRFNAQAMRTDAETLTLGDKSVWVPSTAMLWAVRGRRMLGLRMGPVGAPPAPTAALRGTARAMARNIIGKM